MKKILLIAVLLTLAITMFAADPVAVIAKAKGELSVERNGANNSVQAGELLYDQDLLISGPDALAAVTFIDGGAMLKVFADTRVQITADTKNGKMAKQPVLKSGDLWAKVKSGTGAFSVRTPSAVASVKGTAFLSRVDKAGKSSFFVKEGIVGVKDEKGKERDVEKNEKAVEDNEGGFLVASTEPGDLGDDVEKELQGATTHQLEIELTSPQGKTRTIIIEYQE